MGRRKLREGRNGPGSGNGNYRQCFLSYVVSHGSYQACSEDMVGLLWQRWRLVVTGVDERKGSWEERTRMGTVTLFPLLRRGMRVKGTAVGYKHDVKGTRVVDLM